MAKTIYLMRHGRYDGQTRDGILTPFGRGEILTNGQQLRLELGTLDQITIYHSQMRRAVESAQALAEALQPIRVELVPRSELNCDSNDVKSVVQGIDAIGILVSHMPELEHYTQEITGKPMRFKNAEYKRFDL